jgi:hypothetical protein
MLAAAAMIWPLLAWPVVTAWWLRLAARPPRAASSLVWVWCRWCHSSWIRLTRYTS